MSDNPGSDFEVDEELQARGLIEKEIYLTEQSLLELAEGKEILEEGTVIHPPKTNELGIMRTGKRELAILATIDLETRPNAEIIKFCDSLEEAQEIMNLLEKLHSGYLSEMSKEDRRETEEMLDKLAEVHEIYFMNDDSADYMPRLGSFRIIEIKTIGTNSLGF